MENQKEKMKAKVRGFFLETKYPPHIVAEKMEAIMIAVNIVGIEEGNKEATKFLEELLETGDLDGMLEVARLRVNAYTKIQITKAIKEMLALMNEEEKDELIEIIRQSKEEKLYN